MDPKEQWLREQMERETDECIIWPWRIHHGYAYFRTKSAARLVCLIAYGPAPEGMNDSAHSCGNRACVNKRHLRWDSRKGNLADKLKHGTMPFGEDTNSVKLTKAEVLEIRKKLRHGASQKELAAQFGVSQMQICRIKRRENWTNI